MSEWGNDDPVVGSATLPDWGSDDAIVRPRVAAPQTTQHADGWTVPDIGDYWSTVDHEKNRQAQERGYIEGGVAALGRGTAGVVKSAGGIVKMAAPAAIDSLTMPLAPALPQFLRDKLPGVKKAKELVGGATDAVVDPAIAAIDKTVANTELFRKSPSAQKRLVDGGWYSPKWWLENVSEVVPQLGAQAAAAYASGGSSLVFGIAGGGMAAGSHYNEAIERGVDKETARNEAAVVGAVTAALDKLAGAKVFFAKNPAAKEAVVGQIKEGIVKRGVKGFLAEGGTEAAQEFAADAAQLAYENDPKAFDDWLNRYLTAGALGGVAGGGLNILTGGAGAEQPEQTTTEPTQATPEPPVQPATDEQPATPEPPVQPATDEQPATPVQAPTAPTAFESDSDIISWARDNPEAAGDLLRQNPPDRRPTHASFEDAGIGFVKRPDRLKVLEAIRQQRQADLPPPETTPIVGAKPTKSTVMGAGDLVTTKAGDLGVIRAVEGDWVQVETRDNGEQVVRRREIETHQKVTPNAGEPDATIQGPTPEVPAQEVTPVEEAPRKRKGIGKKVDRPATEAAVLSEPAATAQEAAPSELPSEAIPPKPKKGIAKKKPSAKPLVTRDAVVKAFKKQNVTDLPDGTGWRVELQNGAFLTVKNVDENSDFSQAAMQASMGDVPAGAVGQPRAAFNLTTKDGQSVDGAALIRLVNGRADETSVRHEALHLVRALGLVSDTEWKALTGKHAQGYETELEQEEAIARAAEAWQGPDGLWERFKLYIRDLLNKLGIADATAELVEQRISSGDVYSRPAIEQNGSDTKFQAERPGPRPDLANPGETTEARELIGQIHTDQTNAGLPVATSREANEAEGRRRIEADREGQRKRIIDSGFNDAALPDAADVAAAKMLFNQEAEVAFASRDKQAILKAYELGDAYVRTGTKQSVAFSQRYDPMSTPAQRRKQVINEALHGSKDDPLNKKIDDARNAKNKKLLDKLTDKRATRVIKIMDALKKKGIDLSDLDNVVDDIDKTAQSLREIQTRKATYWDKQFEFWNQMILSGPLTHAANISGNLGNIAWKGVERSVESAISLVLPSKDRATARETAYWFYGGASSLSTSFRNAYNSFRREYSEFERLYMTDPDAAVLPEYQNRFAIKGNLGRLVRSIGWRPLMAADDFFKTMVAHAEVTANAYRIAKNEGLQGGDLMARMEILTNDLQSEAWQGATHEAHALTFQDKGGSLTQKARAVAVAARKFPGMRYIVPFVQTPLRATARGLDLTPAGIAGQMYQNWSDGKNVLSGLSERSARTVLSAMSMYLLWGMVGGDDEEGVITGSNSEDHPYSIKIGDRWFSYARIEPFATGLGVMVDSIKAIKGGNPIQAAITPAMSVALQAQEKTMLSGIGDLLKITSEGYSDARSGMLGHPDSRGAQEAAKWAANFSASWVPNLYKQITRLGRDEKRQVRIWGGTTDPEQRWSRLGQRTLERAELWFGNSHPEVDLWGRDKSESFSDQPQTDLVLRAMLPTRATRETHEGSQFIMRWNMQAQDERDRIGNEGIPPYYTVKGKRLSMTDEQFHQAARLSGAIADALWKTGGYDPDNPDASQAEQLKRDLSDARDKARDLLTKQWGGEKVEPIDPARIALDIRNKRIRSIERELGSVAYLNDKPGESSAKRKERIAEERSRRDGLRKIKERLRASRAVTPS